MIGRGSCVLYVVGSGLFYFVLLFCSSRGYFVNMRRRRTSPEIQVYHFALLFIGVLLPRAGAVFCMRIL